MLEVSLLGEPVIRVGGRTVKLTIKKGLALIALVALEGRTSRLDLSRFLWPSLDESTALRNLRRELARLRDAGLADGLVLERDRVDLAPDASIDVRQFESFLRAGAPAAAVALWRGRFADGLDVRGAQELIARLDAHRVRLVAARHDALETLAVAAEADKDLRASIRWRRLILDDDPLQERVHREVMRLHGLLGERDAARAQFDRCRDALERELGLAPMPETEQLLASLGGTAVAASAAEAAPAADVGMIPDLLPFVGRAAEATPMEQAWAEQRAILLAGPGGIGKSRLAADFAAAHGAFAAHGCRGTDAGIPYGAFTRVLRGLVGAAEPLAVDWIRSELARLLPELGPAPRPLADDTQRLRFMEACAQAWLVLTLDNFASILIDDLHLADAASADLFVFVAQRLFETARTGANAPRLLVTLRDDEAAPVLRERLASLVGDGAARRFDLAPLAGDEVYELVHRLSGAASPQRFAARLFAATGGNAFFLHETLRHLVATGWLTRGPHGEWRTPIDESTADYQELPLPGSVFEAALARVHRAGQAVTRVLEAASVAAEPFDARTLADATALSDFELVEAFDRAESSHLVVSAGGGFRFAHDLLRQALATQLPAARRRLVHGRLAGAGERSNADAAPIARHWLEAGEPQRAVPWLLRAGRQAVDRLAGQEAIAAYQGALAAGADGSEALQADRALAELHYRDDDAEGALAASSSALRRARASGDPALLAEVEVAAAQLDVLLARSAESLSRVDELRARSGLALATRVRIECAASDALRQLGRDAEARIASEKMLQLLEDGPADREHDLLRKDAYQSLARNAHVRGDATAGIESARQMRAVCARLGDEAGIGRAELTLGAMHIVRGDAVRAREHLLNARAVSMKLRDPQQERAAILNLLKIAADEGDAGAVLAFAQDGWRLSPRFASPTVRRAFLNAFFFAHGLRGDLGAALDVAATIREDTAAAGSYSEHANTAIVLSDFYLHLGDSEVAEALVEAARVCGGPTVSPLCRLRLTTTMLHLDAARLAEATECLAACGDADLLQDAQDRATFDLHSAALAIARRDFAAAATALERAAPPNRELAMLRATLRLECHAAAAGEADWNDTRTGAAAAAPFEAARSLLREGGAPAWFALRLRRALWQALLTCAGPDAAEAEAIEFRAELARLASTLARHPQHRERFLARYAG